MKRKVMSLTEETILLADHTKAGAKSSYFFAKLSNVDVFIGNRNPGEAMARAVKKGGGKIILPEEK